MVKTVKYSKPPINTKKILLQSVKILDWIQKSISMKQKMVIILTKEIKWKYPPNMTKSIQARI